MTPPPTRVPYSGFRVGAVLVTAAGETVSGANLGVANYSNTLHVEEVALARALMDGHDEFEAVGVAASGDDLVTPCGTCRQSLAEFCGPDLRVV